MPPPETPTHLTIEQALEIATGLLRSGVWQPAEEIYERVLEAVPDQVDAHHFLGLSRYKRGLHDEGIARVRRAIELAPAHADAVNNLGNMLIERGRLDEAEAAYRRAVEHNPQHFDAHNNLGSLLRERGRLDDALSAYRQALALRPDDGDSYRRVGTTLVALGRLDEARDVYRRWLDVEPQSPLAQHYAAACAAVAAPARASDEYVRRTFDTFATSFDAVLEGLKYRAPALINQAVAARLGAPSRSLDVLDAGAGTGLCGPGLRPYARRLVGVDLSPGMLAKAHERGGYDQLEEAELSAYMRAHPAAFDLIVSADTFVYLGELEGPLAAASLALRPGGHVVFTLERDDAPPAGGFRIHPHGRYAHGEAYVRASLQATGFEATTIERAQPRFESGQAVEGMLVTARKSRET
jgi:predicted TPR repeat methyltransferase